MRLREEFMVVFAVLTGIFSIAFYEPEPVRKLMDWRSSRNTKTESEVSISQYQIYDYTKGEDPDITIDFVKGKHFWNPQLAIWLEDSSGNYLETLLVTTSTARGLFYSGRSASNFKNTDRVKEEEDAPTRRVDALPYWSHKRNHKYSDGFYSPHPSQPLPDAITGATPRENFYFISGDSVIYKTTSFRLMVEVNVAFDENEYYSEYDFLDDSLYHGGTGLLGQPSLIYGTTIRNDDAQRYYILSLIGHGHHSGATGDLVSGMNTITTAKYVVERIVVGISENWYKGN
jgi:hypothetical protein